MRQTRGDRYSNSRPIFRGAGPRPPIDGLFLCLAPAMFRESSRRESAIAA